MNKKLKLIVYGRNRKPHVSQDTVLEFEGRIQHNGVTTYPIGLMTAKLGDIFKKRYITQGKRLFLRPPFRIQKSLVAILMGTEYRKVFLPFLWTKPHSVYLFDAWPESHPEIIRFIDLLKPEHVFFSSSQITDSFKAKGLPCQFHWVPEGIDPAQYQYKPVADKDIDVLAFGRKYDWLHERIVDGLDKAGKNYLYEKVKGQIVFKDREAFIDGLARAKVSVCIPSNITHPERSGTISTMTIRYLQSMAAKTLILGIMPEEMKQLFDYTPIVEINTADPLGQVLDILANYASYQPLIEKNYRQVCDLHNWDKRWEAMSAILT
jgi:glycosyltransferase involved in cell wall biosynthesis